MPNSLVEACRTASPIVCEGAPAIPVKLVTQGTKLRETRTMAGYPRLIEPPNKCQIHGGAPLRRSAKQRFEGLPIPQVGALD